MDEDLDVVLDELRRLAETLDESGPVNQAILGRRGLNQIRQTAATERLNRDGMDSGLAATYRDIIGFATYAEMFLKRDERVIIANHVEVLSIEENFAVDTFLQTDSFREELARQGLRCSLQPPLLTGIYLCSPDTARKIEQVAAQVFDHATFALQRQIVVLGPEWLPDGPTQDIASARSIVCCGHFYPRRPFQTGPPICFADHKDSERA